ncbi:MAG: O-antigen ligase family protein [Anaerolineae bacterium]
MKSLPAAIVKRAPLWLLILAPFYLFPGPTKALALLGLPLLWALQKREKGYFVRHTPFDWPILLMMGMVLVSLYATFSLPYSLPKLAGLLFHVAVFYAVAESVQTRAGLNRSLALYLALGLVVVGLSLLGIDWSTAKIPFLAGVTARLPVLVQGLPGAEAGIHRNQAAGSLLWFFPLQAGLLWAWWKGGARSEAVLRRPILLGLVFGVTVLTFVLAQSRGGLVGGLAALAFLGAVLNRRIRWGVALGLVAAIVAAGVIGWWTMGELLVSDATEAVVGDLGSRGFRGEVWTAARWGVSDFPCTGLGLGPFREVARLLYPLQVSPTYDIAHAHNQFLQTALDLGLAGLVAYVAIWLEAGFLLWQTLRQTEDRFIRGAALGIAASLAGYFVYGLTDTVALGAKPGLFLWWLFALSAGLYGQVTAIRRET